MYLVQLRDRKVWVSSTFPSVSLRVHSSFEVLVVFNDLLGTPGKFWMSYGLNECRESIGFYSSV